MSYFSKSEYNAHGKDRSIKHINQIKKNKRDLILNPWQNTYQKP